MSSWILILYITNTSLSFPMANKEACLKAVQSRPVSFNLYTQAVCLNTNTGEFIRE